MERKQEYTLTQLLVWAALKKLIERTGHAHAYAIQQLTDLPASTVRSNLKLFETEGFLLAEHVIVDKRPRQHLTWTPEGLKELARLGESVTKLEANL